MISRILSGLIRRHSTRRSRHAEHNVRPIHDWVCNGTHRLSDDDRGPIRPNRLALVVKTAALIAMPVTALTYPKKRHAAPGEADPSHCRCGCSRIKLKKAKSVHNLTRRWGSSWGLTSTGIEQTRSYHQ